MKNYVIIFLLFLSSVLACKKEGLTKATQKGANTLSCKVDNKLFKPCYERIIGGPDIPALEGGVLMVDGRRWAIINAQIQCEAMLKSIYLEIANWTGEGEYLLSKPDNRAIYTYDFVYSSQYTGKGKIVITKDDQSKSILSGTFEFSGEDSINNPGKIVEISSGRFDISYK